MTQLQTVERVRGMKDWTYEDVVTTINNIRRFGNLTGVEIMTRMLSQLGEPQKGMHFIHIAGTNGKGSVSAFLYAILREAGLKVGVFTSPHLVDFRERICVNGEMISKEDTTRLGGGLLNRQFDVHPTMFDYCLAMALLYYKEQSCDVVLLETGLGGRLDSTNAVGVPDVSVITKIGYDHTAILGSTLEEIASEKAGIIKNGTSLILESQCAEVLSVFTESAERAGVKDCVVVDPEEFRDCHYAEGLQYFSYRGYEDLKMQMLGTHQYENAAAAILAAEAFLDKMKFGLKAQGTFDEDMSELIRRGIAAARWAGRMEILCKEPFFMVDGAHNSNGVEALRKSLMTLFPGEKFHFIMGVMADKDYENMIEELLPLALDFKTVTVESERALQARTLAEQIRLRGVAAECMEQLTDCFFMDEWDREHKTIAFGSLYFIGEIEAYFSEGKVFDGKLQKRYRNS